MAAESYKKWVIIAILIIVAGIIIIGLTRSERGQERPAGRSMPSGPIVDTGINKTGLTDRTKELPETPEALAALGDKYFEANRFEEAINIYKKALKLDPDDADTYNDLGLALHYTGKTAEAVEALKKGTETGPSFQRAWLSLGFVFAAAGRNEEARPALKKAIELDPDSTPGLEAKRILELIK